MTDPLSRFESEHDEALAALDRLEAAAAALQRGDVAPVRLAVMREVHGVLTSAVKAHNETEERALFPLLGRDAPTGVFVEEHVALRELEQRLARALATDDSATAATTALSIVDLLRAHIARENDVLFPMARALLGESGLAEVARRLAAEEVSL